MEVLEDFGVEPILLLAQVVNFVILLYILKRFLYKPILKVLEERKKRIETSVKQSEDIQKRFDEMSKKQTEILDTEKIVQKNLTKGDKERLIRQALNEIKE